MDFIGRVRNLLCYNGKLHFPHAGVALVFLQSFPAHPRSFTNINLLTIQATNGVHDAWLGVRWYFVLFALFIKVHFLLVPRNTVLIPGGASTLKRWTKKDNE